MKPERVINIHTHLRNDDLAARVKVWREWNVEKVCCQCLPARLAGKGSGNADFLETRKRYPDVLIGFAGPELNGDKFDTPDDIRRYADQGFVGLKFIDPAYPYNHEVYFPLYETAQELGMPILFHTGYLGGATGAQGRVTDAMRMTPYQFDRIARVFPRLTLIGAHMGHPEMNVALYLSEFFPNLYFDFTGGGGKKPHVRMMLSSLLPHAGLETNMADPEENRALAWFQKLVFGTDNPEPTIWIPACEMMLDRLAVPAPLRAKFYYETAAKLLHLPV
jgi:predicted TIM-barrel fold metal-dependent hydrolase